MSDKWNSRYEPHIIVKFIYLLVASDLKISKPAHLKLVYCCCFLFHFFFLNRKQFNVILSQKRSCCPVKGAPSQINLHPFISRKTFLISVSLRASSLYVFHAPNQTFLVLALAHRIPSLLRGQPQQEPVFESLCSSRQQSKRSNFSGITYSS